MSLYNQLFQVDQFAPIVLEALGWRTKESLTSMGRFRDAFVDVINEEVLLVIYTRLGGGNREYHENEIKFLRNHPLYLRDEDDPVDSTYASFFYGLPEVVNAKKMAQLKIDVRPHEKFKRMMKELESGQDTPDVRRAKAIGKSIADKIKGSDNGGIIEV